LKYFIFFAFILVVVFLIFFISFKDTDVIQKSTPQSSKYIDKEMSIKSEKKIKHLDKKRVKQDSSRVFINNIDEELSKLHEVFYFESVSIDEMALEVAHREFVSPIAALKMDVKEFQNLHVGNKIVFANIDNMDYEATIEGVEPMQGSQSLFAHIEEYGTKYPCIITIGEDGSGYIHLSTPKGAYEIELKNAKGYIYKSSEIRHVLSDENIDDVVKK